ncbi:hypothetical protein MAR_000462, partial [Mya arenaria]
MQHDERFTVMKVNEQTTVIPSHRPHPVPASVRGHSSAGFCDSSPQELSVRSSFDGTADIVLLESVSDTSSLREYCERSASGSYMLNLASGFRGMWWTSLGDSGRPWFSFPVRHWQYCTTIDLIHTDASFAWTCTVCDNSNHSITSSILSISSTNSFSALSHENTPLNQKSETQNPHIKRFASKLKFLLVNCQSIVKKKHEFHNLLSDQNPDIVAGTESWPTADHYSSEIFPESLGYTVFRRDRKSGKGGGVFILVKNNLIPSVQPNLNTYCEILWIKLEITGSKPIYISSFYKPHELDIDSIYELEKSLLLAQKLKGQKIILGDFNLSKLSWDTENNPILQAGYNHAVYDKFLDILSDFNLTQMVNEYTREGNILDLLLLSNPTLVQSVNIISGISDHDIVSASISARPTSLKQKPR